jgi:hypothetical protein
MGAEFPGCKPWCRDHIEDLQICRVLMCPPDAPVRVSISQLWCSYRGWGRPVVVAASLFGSVCNQAPGMEESDQVRGLAELMRAAGNEHLAAHLHEVAERFDQIIASDHPPVLPV